MKQWNYLYWVVFPLLLWGLLRLQSGMISGPDRFLGFAESRQVELSLPLDVKVDSVFVKPGQKVVKGMPLLRVLHRETELDARKAQVYKASLDAKRQWSLQEIKAKRAALQSEMEAKLAALQTKNEISKGEATFYRSLLGEGRTGESVEVSAMEREMGLIRDSYRRQIAEVDRLMQVQSEEEVMKVMWDEEYRAIEQTREGFIIRAPFDGIVGSFSLQPGEYREAFAPLVVIFAPAPTLVTAYIDERYNVTIRNGDSVAVTSAFQQKQYVTGQVVNKGNRIVEIPEKFSKVPGVKQYGIEVFIEIPMENPFLQKEVLTIGVAE